MTKFVLAAAAVAGACVPGTALADEALPAPDTIVITATRSSRSIKDVPASVSVVDSQDIELTPSKTLDDVLRTIPSVDLPLASSYEVHPTALNVSMRGVGGIRTLVLLDGVPLNDPFFGYVQWSEVPLQTVERVEVVRGGGATLWGNYAMGGVINILTRPIEETGLVAEAAGGSYGSYRADTHAAFAGDGFGIGLDAGINHSDGYMQQVPEARGPVTVPTAFTARTLAVSADAKITPTLAARARVSYFTNDQDLLTKLQGNRQRSWRFSGTLTQQVGTAGSLALTLFHDDTRFLTVNTGTPEGSDPREVEFIENVHRTPERDDGASLVYRRTFTGLVRELSLGLDYHGIKGRDVGSIFDETGEQVRTDVGSGRQRLVGGFVQADLKPSSQLDALVSIRYQDFFNYKGVDKTPGGLGANVPDRHDTDLDPRVSLRYDAGGGFAIRAAAYRAFRAPTLDNLYRAFAIPGGIFFGNASLRPETLEGAEAGFDFVRGPIRIQATAFTNRITNLIIERNLTDAELPPGFFFGGRLINAGKARSRGAEIELDLRLSSKLSGRFGYTYSDSVVTQNPEDPASVGVQQAGIPRHRFSAALQWEGPRRIHIAPRVRYVSRTNGDPDGLLRTDSHFIVDVAASAPVTRKAEAFIEVENLFDRRYISTNDGFSPPLLGTPLTLTAGMRIRLR